MPNCPNCDNYIHTTPIRDHFKQGDNYIRQETCSKCKKHHYIDVKGNIASETECPGCMVWIARGGPYPKIPCHAIMMHHKIPGYFKEIKKIPNEPKCKGCVIRNPLTRGGLSCLAIPNYHINLPNIDWSKMPSGSSTGTGY
jgi:hypothetical protein